MAFSKVGILILAGAVVVAAGVIVADRYFLPESAIRVDEAAPESDMSMEGDMSGNGAMMEEETMGVAKLGSWQGKAGHRASGTVKLLQVDGVWWLRFEDYEQTQGPDVFLYLTPSSEADSLEEIQAGRKILIDGGPDGGEITKEGNFNQRLPDDFDPSLYHGAAVWCDQFRVPFGTAALEAAM